MKLLLIIPFLLFSISKDENSLKKNSFIDPLTVSFAVANATLSFIDSKSKDKKLSQIQKSLEEYNAKMDVIIGKLDQLGVDIKIEMKDQFYQFILNNLLSVLNTYNVEYSAYHDKKFRLISAKNIYNRLNTQLIFTNSFGYTKYQVICSAMVLHHDLLYILRDGSSETKIPKEVAVEIFKRYANFYRDASSYFQKMIAESNPGNLNQGKYIVYKYNSPSLYKKMEFNLNLSNKYDLGAFSIINAPISNLPFEVNKSTIPFLPNYQFNMTPIRTNGICVNYLEDLFNQNYVDKYEVQKIILKINSCTEDYNHRIKEYRYMKRQVDSLVVIANKWSSEPYNDVTHLISKKY